VLPRWKPDRERSESVGGELRFDAGIVAFVAVPDVHELLDVGGVCTGEVEGLQVEAANQGPSLQFAVAAVEHEVQVCLRAETESDACVAAPERILGALGDAVVEPLEVPVQLVGHETATEQIIGSAVAFAVGVDEARGEVDDLGDLAVNVGRGDRGAGVALTGPNEGVQRRVDAEVFVGVVAAAGPGREHGVLGGLEIAPALDDGAGESTGTERDAGAELGLGLLEIRVQPELILTDVVGRAPGAVGGVPAIADDGRDRAPRHELDLQIQQVAVAIPGVLARRHALIEVGVGPGGQSAGVLELPVGQAKGVDVGEIRLEPETAGGVAARTPRRRCGIGRTTSWKRRCLPGSS
jgi:hypothetical protein